MILLLILIVIIVAIALKMAKEEENYSDISAYIRRQILLNYRTKPITSIILEDAADEFVKGEYSFKEKNSLLTANLKYVLYDEDIDTDTLKLLKHESAQVNAFNNYFKDLVGFTPKDFKIKNSHYKDKTHIELTINFVLDDENAIMYKEK